MSFNIVDLVKDQISDQILGQMGGLLGDQSSKAQAGVENAIPALLSGFTNSAKVPGGADSLFGAIQDQDDGLLDNLGSMLGGDQSNSMIEKGSSVLGSLFGNSGLGSLAGVISGLTGLSKGNTGSLMGMLAPIVLGVLKRKVLGGGLNAGGLLDMLKGQNDNINAAMPVGLSDQLNSSGFLSSISNVGGAAAGAIGNAADSVTDAAGNAIDGAKNMAGNVADGVGDAAGNVADGVRNVAGDAVGTVRDGAGAVGDAAANTAAGGSSMLKKLIPLIALALLGFLGWKMFGGAGKDAVDDAANATGNAATAVTEAASDAASATTEAASDAVSATTEAASDAAGAVTDAMDFDIGQAGTDLESMFGNAKSSLEGITDLDSAKSAIPGLTEMGEKFNGIADMVPEDARGTLGPVVSKGLEMLEPLLEKVRAIPGVGALIDPVLGPMIEKMQDMAG